MTPMGDFTLLATGIAAAMPGQNKQKKWTENSGCVVSSSQSAEIRNCYAGGHRKNAWFVGGYVRPPAQSLIHNQWPPCRTPRPHPEFKYLCSCGFVNIVVS